MLRIRLSRVGKKKQPHYRIVVTDQRNPREGAHLEVIGHYDPLSNPANLVLKDERAIHWLKVGAQPSDAAAKILSKAGIMEQAGVAPFVYVGKQMPKGSRNPRKGAGEEAAAPAPVAAAPAAAPAAAAEAPAPEAAGETPALEAAAEAPAPEAAAEEPAPEAAAEAPAPEAPAADASAAEETPADEPVAEAAADEPPAEEPAAEEAAPAEDTETT